MSERRLSNSLQSSSTNSFISQRNTAQQLQHVLIDCSLFYLAFRAAFCREGSFQLCGLLENTGCGKARGWPWPCLCHRWTQKHF
eukprot:jgi/Botrbrau1/10457/Bobra.0133s0064.1